MTAEPILRAVNLRPAAPRPAAAAEHLGRWQPVSFSVRAGEHVVIVGAPGSGKTALARAVALIQKPAAGQVYFAGEDITRLKAGRLRALRGRLQFVGGDPMHTLPPRASVGDALMEPLSIHRRGSPAERRRQVEAAATRLHLNALLLNREARTLSAALRQRAALARALTLQPDVLVCDELVERLEPAAARPLLEVLAHACRAGGLAWVWTTSDEAAARAFSDRVLYLRDGQLTPA